MDLPIEVRGRCAERHHLEALRALERRRGSGWVAPALCIGGPVALVLLSVASGHSLQQALVGNVFWMVLGSLVLLVGIPAARRQSVRHHIEGNPAATAPTLYRFTGDGFEERECPVETTLKWESVTEAAETPAALLLFLGRAKAYLVPREAFATSDQLDAVRSLLRKRLGDRAHL